MPSPSQFLSILFRPTNLVFEENFATLERLKQFGETMAPSVIPRGTLWRLPDSRLQVLETPGGLILYGDPHGQRILVIDRTGTPLHECSWEAGNDRPRLLRARLQLDWGQWVGIKPEGLVNVARFDISKRPGWERLTRDDLCEMAARAMQVAPDEVGFFYDEASLMVDPHGQVTIRHRKDALYVLDEGTFDRARFMACMGAMHWGRIDFLPVVELFQSLLAGTGSAVFELIRALYDDQNQSAAPEPLRYRGIPTYPSPQAYQLFSTYFVPDVPGGGDPFPVFMQPGHSADVRWSARPEAPIRVLDTSERLAITTTGGAIQKVTKQDDAAALPFVRPRSRGFAPGGRIAGTTKNRLQLQDNDQREELPLKSEWGVSVETPLPPTIARPLPNWRDLFPEGAPKLEVEQAYFAVPMYPDDEQVVEELATQPLAMEQILEYLEQIGHAAPAGSGDVLIDQWDAVIAELIEAINPRAAVILYSRPEFAQRQAQRLWDQLGSSGTVTRVKDFRFLPSLRRQSVSGQPYGIIVQWIPFAYYQQRSDAEGLLDATVQALRPGGLAILAGPPWLRQAAAGRSLRCEASVAITETSGVGMLRAILPKARINPEATLFLLTKPRP